MKVASFFSGIGGIDLALERAWYGGGFPVQNIAFWSKDTSEALACCADDQ